MLILLRQGNGLVDDDLILAARRLLEACAKAAATLATAESCTGGLISAALTEIPGSSDWFERGFVTYSNRSKSELLGVSPQLIEEEGAVSMDVAVAMAEGALAHAGTIAALAVTGVAGPGGGTAQKPVGLVHIAAARQGWPTRHQRCLFQGDRAAVRKQTAIAALGLLALLLSEAR